MLNFVIRLFISAIAVMITTYLLPGIHVADFITAVLVVCVLALLNAFVKPMLIILTIPITIFTLGLFLLVINAGIIMLASWIITPFKVDGFWWALLFSLILSITNSLLNRLIPESRQREYN